MSNEFWHVSMDISLEEKEFIPRIPKYRCKDEDNKIKRVCGTNSLESSIGAFPYKGIFLSNFYSRKENYLSVYKTSLKGKEYKSSEELKGLVPDVHLTNECWILNEFKCKPYLIRVKKLALENYNKYTCEEWGNVKTLEYDKAIEDYDREMEYTFINKKYLRKALEFADKNNIKYEIVENDRCHLYHRRYAFHTFYDQTYFGTSKTYSINKVKFYINKNVDVSELWVINNSHEDWTIKKNISTRKFCKDLYRIMNEYEGDYQGFNEALIEEGIYL